MRYTARALLAVALLVGFYVLAAGLVAGLAYGAYAVLHAGLPGYAALKMGVLAIVLGAAVGTALLAHRRPRSEAPGMLLTEPDQPALWQEVRALAAEVGTRVPDEIRLITEVNAAVSEDTRMLGLRGGTRRMYVGVPLLLGLEPLELRSVLAHELGHYSARHTALAPLAYRGKEAIGRLVRELGPDSVTGRLFNGYGRFYVAVMHSVARRQELEADAFSARLAGSEAAASSLRAIAALDAAWEHFTSSYAGLGQEAGLRPQPLFAGFGTLIADPEVQAQLSVIRAEQPSEAASVYDTHPPVAERIARIEASAHPAPPRPGAPLLARVDETLSVFEDALYDGSGLRPAAWDRVVAASATDRARRRRHALGRLAGSEATFASFTQRIGHRGPLGLLDAPPDEERAAVADMLGDATADVLTARRAASYALDWAGPARLVGPDGTHLDPWTPLEELAATGDSRPFLAWLAEVGIDGAEPLGARLPEAPEGLPDRGHLVHGAAAIVRGPRWSTLLVTDAGLALVPVTGGQRASLWLRNAVGSSAFRRGGELIIEQVLATPVADRLGGPGFLPWDDIGSARATDRRLRASSVEIVLRDGSRRTLRFDSRTFVAGEPWAGLGHHLGERLVVTNRSGARDRS